jgi:hypothetical protein
LLAVDHHHLQRGLTQADASKQVAGETEHSSIAAWSGSLTTDPNVGVRSAVLETDFLLSALNNVSHA